VNLGSNASQKGSCNILAITIDTQLKLECVWGGGIMFNEIEQSENQQ